MIGIGARELIVVGTVAVLGLALAATVVLTPWYSGSARPPAPVVRVISPGGVADRP